MIVQRFGFPVTQARTTPKMVPGDYCVPYRIVQGADSRLGALLDVDVGRLGGNMCLATSGHGRDCPTQF